MTDFTPGNLVFHAEKVYSCSKLDYLFCEDRFVGTVVTLSDAHSDEHIIDLPNFRCERDITSPHCQYQNVEAPSTVAPAIKHWVSKLSSFLKGDLQ